MDFGLDGMVRSGIAAAPYGRAAEASRRIHPGRPAVGGIAHDFEDRGTCRFTT
jgi:hypothetical protein